MMTVETVIEDDDALMGRIVRRDPQGIALLYDRHGGIAFALALRILGDRGAAEDAVQEAFLKVWRYAPAYDAGRGTMRTWLLAIVHHQTINMLRTQRSRGGIAADIDAIPPLAGDEDVAGAVIAGIEGERVRAALGVLTEDQRRVVVLAYFGGLTHREIAERAAIPLGTVKGRMRLGLRRLRAALVQGEPIIS